MLSLYRLFILSLLLYFHIFTVRSTIYFTCVTQNAPWAPRYKAQLHSLRNNLTYHSSTGIEIAPVGSFLLFGGFSEFINSRVPQFNDVWISSDDGSSWILIAIQSFSANASTYCSDPETDFSFILTYGSYFHQNQYSPIWRSQNQSIWNELIPVEPSLNPFVNRAGSVCTIDSQSQIYYMVGYNSTNPLVDSGLYADVWRSTDLGFTWQIQSSNQFTPRYSSMVGIHLNNSHLDHRDVIYIIGGITNTTMPTLCDVWVSSDQGRQWFQINPNGPWRVTWSNSFHISKDGILIMSSCFDYIEIWTSLDGGVTWGRCGPRGYHCRWRSSITLDTQGYLYVIGGYDFLSGGMYNDVWKSDISFYDWNAVADACNLKIPLNGVGLTSWPSSSSSSSSSSLFSSSQSLSSSSLSPSSSSSSSIKNVLSSSSSSSTGSTSNSESTNLSAIVGIVIAVSIVLLSLIGVLIYIRYMRRKYGRIVWLCCRGRPRSSVDQHNDQLLLESR